MEVTKVFSYSVNNRLSYASARVLASITYEQLCLQNQVPKALSSLYPFRNTIIISLRRLWQRMSNAIIFFLQVEQIAPKLVNLTVC